MPFGIPDFASQQVSRIFQEPQACPIFSLSRFNSGLEAILGKTLSNIAFNIINQEVDLIQQVSAGRSNLPDFKENHRT